jgi:hypothetical protein
MKHEEKINLFMSFFIPKEEERLKELFKVLRFNLACEDIERIYLLSEHEINLPEEFKVHKIKVLRTESRTTYKDCIEAANAAVKDDSTISIIANCDIYFDDRNLRLIKQLNFTDTAFALSRWDVDNTGKARHFNYEWSQDTWIFKGMIPDIESSFIFGVPACDNRFAFEMKKHFRRIANPSFTIKTYHLHNVGVQRYSEADRLAGSVLSIHSEGVKTYMKQSMLFIQKGKVGDILICLPIVHELSKQYLIDWMLPKEYHSILDRISYARAVSEPKKTYSRTLDLSFGQGGSPEAWWQKEKDRFDSFVTAKYELAGMDVNKRKDLSYNRDKNKEEDLMNFIDQMIGGRPYALVHRSSDYGEPARCSISKGLEVVEFKPIEGYEIFDWYEVILQAKEIHCIDSSLCNFVELIPEAHDIKKYYYKTSKVPAKYDETLLENNWTRIDQFTVKTKELIDERI